MGIRDRLEEIAEELGSQVALANAAEVTESRVSQWLKGDMKRFSAEAALHIEEHAGYLARWLVLGKGPKRARANVAAEPSSSPYIASDSRNKEPGTDDEKLLFIIREWLMADTIGRDAIWLGAKVAIRKRGSARSRKSGTSSPDSR